MDVVALTTKYFEVWNSHDVAGIQALHAAKSRLTDWDGTHGPTNADVSKGIGGIWTAVPAIQIEVRTCFCGARRLEVDSRVETARVETTCCVNLRCGSAPRPPRPLLLPPCLADR